jgi:anthranilate synthase component 1/para-aminobenzoate synthetase component 1
MVRQAKEYIKSGDIYQANLSQRLSTAIEGDPWSLYKILRKINPSPFASFLDFDDVKIVSSSPERLLFVKGEGVETRPIAGTRPRGRDRFEDKKLSRDLILSPKERAEHIMLVDLERNDLGRVCEYGTVEVNELMTLERYSHVIHIVSNIRGRLCPGMDRFSALSACFPGGTITGTPKIRSMEIIDELEKVSRSIYTGSIGYLNYGGEMDLNIVIRTFVIVDGALYIQVGAGIVADSDPEREYYETLHKAEALITTIRKVQVNGTRLRNEALCHN